MNIEILHTFSGDKKKKIDTSTDEGKAAAADFVTIQIRKGTALFLQRGKKTYRVKEYDPATDSLVVIAEQHGKEKPVKAKSSKGKVAAVPAIAGGK